MKKIQKNEGFTLIELLIVVAIIGIIAAIAVPGLLRARQSGNETSAIGTMRAINSAQSGYAATCGNGYYSPTLANLGAAPTAGGSPFLSPDVAKSGTVTKSGYEIDMTATAAATAPATCNGLAAGAAGSGYNASATPISGGGSRSFATNTTGTIYQAYQTTVLTAGDNAAPTGGVPIQ